MTYPQTFMDWLEDNAKVKKTQSYLYDWDEAQLIPKVEYIIVAKIERDFPSEWRTNFLLFRYRPEIDVCRPVEIMKGISEERIQEAKAFIHSKVIAGEVP